MEIGQLKAFCKVVEFGNFHQAANALHLTQPAISLKIKKLEESLGSILLIRTNKSVSLSHEGKVFLPHAEAVLRAVEEARYSLEAFNTLDKGKVVIGCSDTVAKHLLFPKLKLFLANYPNIEIQVLNKTSDELAECFDKGMLDIAFLIDRPGENTSAARLWLEYQDCLVLPTSHAFSKKKAGQACHAG